MDCSFDCISSLSIASFLTDSGLLNEGPGIIGTEGGSVIIGRSNQTNTSAIIGTE